MAVTAVAEQGPVCRLEGKGAAVVDGLFAGVAVAQFRLVSGGAEQAEMEQGGSLQRRGSTVYCIEQPEEQGKNFRVRILFTGKANDQLTGQHGHYIALVHGPQGEKWVFEFSLAEKE